MGDEAVAEKKERVSEQKLWPIFLVGFALTGFGFYFVFAEGKGDMEVEDSVAEPIDGSTIKPIESTDTGPVSLTYGHTTRRIAVELEQRSVKPSGKNLKTTMTFELVDEPVEPAEGEAFAYLRSFENVSVALRSDSEAVGTDVTNEVVRLVEATKLEIGFEDNGERVRIDVVSSESAQLRPTLDLLKDATRLVFPPMPTEPVNPDEAWSIRMPAEIDGSDILEVEGMTEFTFKIIAANPKIAQLEIGVAGDVRATWDDAEERRGHLETVISGTGTMNWDRKRGDVAVIETELERRTLEPDGQELESSTIIVRGTSL